MPRKDAFRVILEEYLEMLGSTGRSDATVTKYGEVLRLLRRTARGIGLTKSPARWSLEETLGLLRSATTWPDGRPKANNTQLLYTTVLRQFLTHCGNAALDAAIRAREYRLVTSTRRNARWPSIEQVIELRVTARQSCPPGTYIMVVLAFEGLLRRGEISRLRLEDVHEGHLDVRGKGGKDRQVYITSRTRMEVEAFLEGDRRVLLKGRSSPYLVAHAYYGSGVAFSPISISGRVRAAGARCDPPFMVSPHDLRRSGARAVYVADPSERTLSRLQEALGHSSIDQTRSYIGIGILDQQDAMEARDRYLARNFPKMYLSSPSQAPTGR